MNVLVINTGSSSLKYQLFNDAGEMLAKGLCERIGIDGKIKHTAPGKEDYTAEAALSNHEDAVRLVSDLLINPKYSVLTALSEIGAVGHRVVHGGEFFSESVVIDGKVMDAIQACCAIAPLHNPPSLTGIEACAKVMGDIPQVAVFDTAFHQTMPEKAYLYAIPYKYYEQNGIRRYGFHGTSHRYVSSRAAELLGRPITELKIVTCHLGNGSSITAVDRGRSVDTSMGFTPLEGLPMGTRSGSLDPAIVGYISELEGITAADVVNLLNKSSGVFGISGVSSDFRDLSETAHGGGEKALRAKAAIDLFNYSVKKYIGSFAAAMEGLDAVVFTAGVGENNVAYRESILRGLEFMGIELDTDKNNVRSEAIVSKDSSRVKVLVIPTDEERVIAMDTIKLVSKLG